MQSFVGIIPTELQALISGELSQVSKILEVPTTPEEIEMLVSAEIPDPSIEPILYDIVTGRMFHGPCPGRPCWLGKGCKLGYPKPFVNRTVIIEGAYPACKRRDTGIEFVKNGHTFSNAHFVPYNKFLSLMFECHIYVEIPVNTTAVKYIYKYITKGHNQSLLKINGCNEIKAFIDGRYVSPPKCE